MKIRKAKKSDFKKCQNIIYDDLDLVKINKKIKDRLRNKDYTLKNIEKAWEKTDMFVCEKRGLVKGCGRLEKSREIRMIYVDPKDHRKKIGTFIMNGIEKHAKRKGFKSVFVKALKTATGFYKKLGYKKIKTKEKDYVKMRKELK